jgi:hypothetical protein
MSCRDVMADHAILFYPLDSHGYVSAVLRFALFYGQLNFSHYVPAVCPSHSYTGSLYQPAEL